MLLRKSSLLSTSTSTLLSTKETLFSSLCFAATTTVIKMKTTSPIAVRKVCSNESLYNFPPSVCQKNVGYYTLADNSKELSSILHNESPVSSSSLPPQPPPPPFLSAVILLNSPSNGEWEFVEYQRLYKLYRSSRVINVTTKSDKIESNNNNGDDLSENYIQASINNASHHESSPPYCYFICADGAYEAMCSFFTSSTKQHINNNNVPVNENGDATTTTQTSHHEHLQIKEYAMNTVDVVTARNDGDGKNENKNYCCKNDLPLCDVIIGDMDSCDRSKLHTRSMTTTQYGSASFALKDAQLSHCYVDKTQLKWYDTVDAIPEEVLEVIRAKIHNIHNNKEYTYNDSKCSVCEPVILPVKCQMTTDFRKCVLLLKRLKHAFPSDFGLTHDENDKLEQLASSCTNEKTIAPSNNKNDSSTTSCNNNENINDNFVPKSYEQLYLDCTKVIQNELHRPLFDYSAVNDENEKVALQKEEARCKALLAETISECTTDVHDNNNENNHDNEQKLHKTLMRTVILPNIAVLGALGGRFDHEMGVACCLLHSAKDFHLMVTNRSNVMFACWPDGITQWLSRGFHNSMPAEKTMATVDTADKRVTNQISCSDSTKKEEDVSASRMAHKGNDKTSNNNRDDKSKSDSSDLLLPASAELQGTADEIKKVQVTCGVIPYGEVAEMETTGLVWNIVNGRPEKCDEVTQTSSYRFRFDEIVSACNVLRDDVVTIDLRALSNRNIDNKDCQCRSQCISHAMKSTHNPPTIFTT